MTGSDVQQKEKDEPVTKVFLFPFRLAYRMSLKNIPSLWDILRRKQKSEG